MKRVSRDPPCGECITRKYAAAGAVVPKIVRMLKGGGSPTAQGTSETPVCGKWGVPLQATESAAPFRHFPWNSPSMDVTKDSSRTDAQRQYTGAKPSLAPAGSGPRRVPQRNAAYFTKIVAKPRFCVNQLRSSPSAEGERIWREAKLIATSPE